MSDVFAAWMEEATPDEVSVGVCFNRRLYREFYDAIEATRDPDYDDGLLDDEPIEERIVHLQEQVRAAEKQLVFRCLPMGQWKKLADQHPPTAQQRKADPQAEVNEDTFWQVAMAASCVSPGLTVEQADWMRENLPRQKWMEIVQACQRANVGGSEIPKSVSSIVARLRHEPSSTTAAAEESPDPSSGDESAKKGSRTGSAQTTTQRSPGS